ncbi:MAG TPA: N-acetylglucosamine-6-phosphate deacetylase [Paracoccaceae bacterium]|nr:N-acetylglucosamine-6-phosphate deacetylase [Paracoccaceae bacterium]
MMPTALLGARIFDGRRFHADAALIVSGKEILGIVPHGDVPSGALRRDCGGLLLAPGFVDWQVNGGGGVHLNQVPTVEGLRTIADAHAAFGTTALLPTVITDAPAVTAAAAAAVAEAIAAGLPGVVGIHFEGPHISPERPGIHAPQFIRPMAPADFERLTRRDLGRVVATLAPEVVGAETIERLDRAGVVVSAGHSNASFEAARRAFAAGVRAVTHLFNAMSPLHHREPGLVGAALLDRRVTCGLILDGHHVHAAAFETAFRLRPPERMTLVTDAMSTVGTDLDGLELHGRRILRQDGRLCAEDGTLAGSDLDMASAVRFAVRRLGIEPASALRMASLHPAQLLGLAGRRGHFGPGAFADIVALDDDLFVRAVWRKGEAFRGRP